MIQIVIFLAQCVQLQYSGLIRFSLFARSPAVTVSVTQKCFQKQRTLEDRHYKC